MQLFIGSIKWIFISILTFCLVMGLYYAFNQYNALSTSVPVSAKVVSSEVDSYSVQVKGGMRTAYAPKIKFRYFIHKKPYISDIYALYNDEWANYDASWVQQVVHQYPPGKKITAYYPIAEPSKAFLYRHYSFIPYFLVMFSLFIFFIGSAGIGRIFPKYNAPQSTDEGGFYEIFPVSPISGTRAFWHRAKTWILLIGLVPLAHYYMVADPPYSGLALFMLGDYAFFLFIVYYLRCYYGAKEVAKQDS